MNIQKRRVHVDDDKALAGRGSAAGSDIITMSMNAEIDKQVATAKAYPRNVSRFIESAITMATSDEETAAACMYALPRDGKTIEGPSARLAELLMHAWGNLRAQAGIVSINDRYVIAEGRCWDLETNNAVDVRVMRRITDRRGNRYNDDMIAVTATAACSIAIRNAILKIIPGPLVKHVYEAARRVAIGDVKSLAAKRDEAIRHFSKMGVSAEAVCALLGRESVDEITIDDIGTLRGIATAIKEGEATIESVFQSATEEDVDDAQEHKSRAVSIREKLALFRESQAQQNHEGDGVADGGAAEHEEPQVEEYADDAPAADVDDITGKKKSRSR